MHWHSVLTADLKVRWISTLLVDPARRRNGVARLLLKAASQAARPGGCGDLVLTPPLGPGGLRPFLPAPGFFYSCLLAPLLEETIFRGFLFKAFANRWQPWPAALLSSALFAIMHGYSLFGTVMVFLYGMIFTGLYHRTGSLWPGMICHAAGNLLLLNSWS